MLMNTYKDVVPTQTVFQHLHTPDWAIVDCRFDLKDPEWGFESYQQEHIPGAVYAHLDRDLANPVTAQSGRHPLPDIELIAQRLSNWGIGNHTQVVVYDTNGGGYAARLWWLLRFLGHTAVAILDGDFHVWQSEGYPTAKGIEQRQPEVFVPNPQWEMLVSTEQVENIYTNPAYRLVDARAPERFRGEQEPIDTKAGHIPGAVNRFHGMNLNAQGKFLPPETLRQQFQDLLGEVQPEHTVVYCGSGVTSCHHLIAMERAGLSGAKLYLGSWSEWIRDEKRPISK